MSKPEIAVMAIGYETTDGAIPVTCTTLDGHQWTRPALDPSVVEAVETLVELASARAPESGTLVLHPGTLDFVDVHQRLASLGWRHGSAEDANLSGWSRVWQPKRPKVVLCDRSRADDSPLFGKRTCDAEAATALVAMHRAVGVPWYSTGALTGVIALTETWTAEHAPHWHTRIPDHLPKATELHWTHPRRDELTAVAIDRGEWDGRKFGLAALDQLRVSMSGLKYASRAHYEPEIPGKWQVDADEITRQVVAMFGEDFPPVIDPETVVMGRTWLDNPMMDLLNSWRVDCSVFGAYVSPTGWAGFPLRPLARRLRDTIYAGADESVLAGCKEVYSRLPSIISAPGGSCSRRDWSDSHEQVMRASVLRRVRKVQQATDGLLPVRIARDAISYAWALPGELEAIRANIGEGERIGNMRRVK